LLRGDEACQSCDEKNGPHETDRTASRFAHVCTGALSMHALAGTAHDLAASRLAFAEDLRDFRVLAIENFAQQESGAPVRREAAARDPIPSF